MKLVSKRIDNDTLSVCLTGSVNSVNSAEVEAEIGTLLKNEPATKVLIDAENLEYISSAGLRIILRLHNQLDELKIINASVSVYEVFEMTGFTEMMTVEKAFRKLSVDGCEVIGQGANGVVYRLDADTIIKVYRNSDSLPDIKRERELARKAFVLGIPTAIPYDVVKVGNTYGSVFELLNAKSFAKLLLSEPEKTVTYVGLYVDVLKKLHRTVVKPEDMPSIKESALGWADFLKDYLTDEQYEKLYGLFSEIPVRMTMIHGDYHIKNIMWQNGEVLLIDMDTLSYGHPIFEFSQMYLAYVGFGEHHPEDVEHFLGLPHEQARAFWSKSIRAYLGMEPDADISGIEDKIKAIAYTRLVRRIIKREPDDEKLEFYMTRLIDVLGRVDSLSFQTADFSF